MLPHHAFITPPQPIHSTIRLVFSDPTRRRVAPVAFVSNAAQAFLPPPQSLERVCWPKTGARRAVAVQKLRRLGAKVRLADNRPMKLHWAKGIGSSGDGHYQWKRRQTPWGFVDFAVRDLSTPDANQAAQVYPHTCYPAPIVIERALRDALALAAKRHGLQGRFEAPSWALPKKRVAHI